MFKYVCTFFFNADTFLWPSFRCLDMYFYFSMQQSNLFLSTKAVSDRSLKTLWRRLFKSSLKTLLTLPENNLKAGSLFEFSESRLSESSPKALWKPNQSSLSESKLIFVESSLKAEWLLLKALRKPFKSRVNCDNTNFCDKIAYVGDPFFCRRRWTFRRQPVGQLLPPWTRPKKSKTEDNLMHIRDISRHSSSSGKLGPILPSFSHAPCSVPLLAAADPLCSIEVQWKGEKPEPR